MRRNFMSSPKKKFEAVELKEVKAAELKEGLLAKDKKNEADEKKKKQEFLNAAEKLSDVLLFISKNPELILRSTENNPASVRLTNMITKFTNAIKEINAKEEDVKERLQKLYNEFTKAADVRGNPNWKKQTNEAFYELGLFFVDCMNKGLISKEQKSSMASIFKSKKPNETKEIKIEPKVVKKS